MSTKAKKPKRKRVWLYLTEEDARRLHLLRLTLKLDHLKEADVVSQINAAALRACEAKGYACIPTEFAITEPRLD